MSRPRRKQSKLDPNLSKGIIAIILVVLASIITLSFFNRAGVVGIVINDYILSALFGEIRFATPVIIAILAWFLVKDRSEYNYRPTHWIGSFIFFLSLSSLFHISFKPNNMWTEALAGNGGGIFGMFAWPLKNYLGEIAGYIILAGMTFISVFLIFNTSIAKFIFIHKKLFFGLGAIGKFIFNSIKTLFIRQNGQIKIKGDYQENIDCGDERKFFKKNLDDEEIDENREENILDEKEKENEDDEESNAETENLENDSEKSKPDDIWSKRIIVRNLPSTNLLSDKKSKPTSGDIKANAEIIRDTLSQFGIEVDMGEVRVGPTVTQYSLKPFKGIKLSRITSLSNDLALALAAHPIRIEAPIPGKSLVGIEVPNQKAAIVSFKELIESNEYRERKHNMMVALGKDVAGKVWFADLPRMPHMLIAGATGSGKTVCINTIIMSLLYQNTAETLRIIMVDPKRVELTLYNGIPHLLTPVITNVQKTVNALKWTIGEMDRRFEILATSKCRDISSYNQKYPRHQMPHIVFVIDELADLMASAANEVEAGIIRLAQMARAVGVHLIVATQRPSVDVITGLMKANIPARLAFSVASIIDSRTILDCPGAEKLLGRGDMLILTAEMSKPVRIQGSLISEEEVENVVEYLKGDEEPEYDESIVQKPNGGGTINLFGGASDDLDPLFEEAKTAVIEAKKASASLLQRRLKIGYARAARILDEMESAGIIGPGDGAKPREILMTKNQICDKMDSGGELNAFGEKVVEEDTEEDAEEFEEESNEEKEKMD